MPIDVKPWVLGRGRTTRARYWLWLLSLTAAGYLAHVFSVSFAEARVLPIEWAALVLLGAQVSTGWLAVTLIARRLHDVDRTGWWQAAPLAMLLAGYALAEPAWAQQLGLTPTAAFVAALVGIVAYTSFLIALGMVRGSPTGNRFGPAPAR